MPRYKSKHFNIPFYLENNPIMALYVKLIFMPWEKAIIIFFLGGGGKGYIIPLAQLFYSKTHNIFINLTNAYFIENFPFYDRYKNILCHGTKQLCQWFNILPLQKKSG